jgi:hypothetical protein
MKKEKEKKKNSQEPVKADSKKHNKKAAAEFQGLL